MKKIAIVGDTIIDEYYFVNANKISPEFPIPILASEDFFPQKVLPGGAANVCYQFLNFDKDVSYFGFVDFEAVKILEEYFLIDNCVLMNNFSKVPRKKRFYQDHFPLCRIDIESKNYRLSKQKLNNLQQAVCKNLYSKKFDVVIFSDYGKGIFNEHDNYNFIRAAGNSIKIVDPKNGPVSKWFGCDIIKPNSKEAKELSGKSNWKEQARFFKETTSAKAVIITQEGDGVVGIINKDYFEIRPSVKTTPTSVIGAGDCFISLLADGISDGLETYESIERAFYGSSIYVNNKYNKPIHPADLSKNKIVNPEILKKRNFKLCFTNGCFDLGLTTAHIDLIKYSKQKGEKLVVALNSDDSVRRIKGENRPFFNFNERAKILSSIEFVDYIVKFEENTPIEVMEKINPDLIIKGGDYELHQIIGHDKYSVEIFEYQNSYSTTDKIKHIF